MAVLDFRGGGFHGVRPRQVRDMMFGEQDQGYQPMDPQPSQDGYSMAARATRALNYFGALVSVALMIGLIVWGYQLVVRDVSGIPVIRAIEGAARIAPEEPGGKLAEYSGLAVNTVAAGQAPARVDRVAIAPSAASLTDEDVPMGSLGATAQPMQADDDDAVLASPRTPVLDLPHRSGDDRMADALLAETTPEGSVSATVTDDTGGIVKPEEINKALAEAAVPQSAVLADSSRPAPRPRRLASVAPANDAAPVAAMAAPETRPEAAPAPAKAEMKTVQPASGAAIAQIGAFDSDAVARSEWQRLSGKSGGLFAGKSPVIQKTERNGRTFWRLRVAGFSGKDDARSFCSSLKAKGTDCIALSN